MDLLTQNMHEQELEKKKKKPRNFYFVLFRVFFCSDSVLFSSVFVVCLRICLRMQNNFSHCKQISHKQIEKVTEKARK